MCASQFSSQIFLGCLSFPDLEGSAFSTFGVSWVPEVISHMYRGAFYAGHFFKTKNWKSLAPGVDLEGSKFSRSEFSRFGWTEFLGLRSEV